MPTSADFITGMHEETKRRIGVLCALYDRRRASPDEPGMSVLEIEKTIACPRRLLGFTIWYLKDKGHLRQTEDSSLAITSGGVDQIESLLTRNSVSQEQ